MLQSSCQWVFFGVLYDTRQDNCRVRSILLPAKKDTPERTIFSSLWRFGRSRSSGSAEVRSGTPSPLGFVLDERERGEEQLDRRLPYRFIGDSPPKRFEGRGFFNLVDVIVGDLS
jgi:hypothetical protein